MATEMVFANQVRLVLNIKYILIFIFMIVLSNSVNAVAYWNETLGKGSSGNNPITHAQWIAQNETHTNSVTYYGYFFGIYRPTTGVCNGIVLELRSSVSGLPGDNTTVKAIGRIANSSIVIQAGTSYESSKSTYIEFDTPYTAAANEQLWFVFRANGSTACGYPTYFSNPNLVSGKLQRETTNAGLTWALLVGNYAFSGNATFVNNTESPPFTVNITNIWLTSPEPDQKLYYPPVSGNTSDSTPTFNLSTNTNVNCSLSNNNATWTNCTTTGTTGHICTYPTELTSGTPGIYFVCNTTNTTFYRNVSIYLDALAPYFITIPNNVTYIYNTNKLSVQFVANDTQSSLNWTINDTTRFELNVTNWLYNKTYAYVGYYDINITINDSLNNKNSTIFRLNITKAVPNISLNITPLWSVINGTQTSVYGYGCPSGLTCGLYRNNAAESSNPYITKHNNNTLYNYTTNGNDNYSALNLNNTLYINTIQPLTNTPESTNYTHVFANSSGVPLCWITPLKQFICNGTGIFNSGYTGIFTNVQTPNGVCI